MELAFFPRASQGLNALSRPGLDPGSSDSEPSALTTGLLNKTVAFLTTPVKSSILYGRTVIRAYGRTVVHPNFFRLDGLLIFCIIMGLRSASSAIISFVMLTPYPQ